MTIVFFACSKGLPFFESGDRRESHGHKCGAGTCQRAQSEEAEFIAGIEELSGELQGFFIKCTDMLQCTDLLQ